VDHEQLVPTQRLAQVYLMQRFFMSAVTFWFQHSFIRIDQSFLDVRVKRVQNCLPIINWWSATYVWKNQQGLQERAGPGGSTE